jgi:Putative MetA-pathway of phenol degradation
VASTCISIGAASQFLSKQFQIGLLGYVYKEIGCDSGSGDRVGCFQSQVASIGPQLGFIFPVGDMQGYINLKGYRNLLRRTHLDDRDGCCPLIGMASDVQRGGEAGQGRGPPERAAGVQACARARCPVRRRHGAGEERRRSGLGRRS